MTIDIGTIAAFIAGSTLFLTGHPVAGLGAAGAGLALTLVRVFGGARPWVR